MPVGARPFDLSDAGAYDPESTACRDRALAQTREGVTNLEQALGSGGDSGCLLYTSDAADDLLCVDLGGRRIIKKKIINIHPALLPTTIITQL